MAAEDRERGERRGDLTAAVAGAAVVAAVAAGVYAVVEWRGNVLFARAVADLAERRPCPGCQRRRTIRGKAVTTTEEASTSDRPDRAPVA